MGKNMCLVLNISNGNVYSRKDCKFNLDIPKQSIDELYDNEMFNKNKPVLTESTVYKYTRYNNQGTVDDGSNEDADASDSDEASDDELDEELYKVPIMNEIKDTKDNNSNINNSISNDSSNIISNEKKYPYWQPDVNSVYHYVNNIVDYQYELWYNELVIMNSSSNSGTSTLSLPIVPKSVEEALGGSDKDLWIEAIELELKSLDDHQVFSIANDQEGRTMKTRLLLTTSFRNDFTIKYKARLVACGYSQIYGLDYKETYAPTTSNYLVFIMLFVSLYLKLELASADVSTAFLEGDNDSDLYCRLPPGLSNYNYRLKINRSLYGEKQSPKIWNDKLNDILFKMKFKRCECLPTLYYLKNDYAIFIIVVFVDDLLLATNSKSNLDLFIVEIQTYLSKVSLFYPLNKYIGINIEYDKTNAILYLNQDTYINEIVKDNSMITNVNESITTPMSDTYNLRTELANIDNASILEHAGKFRYLADRCRPDLLVAVSECSSYSGNPSDKHIRTIKRMYNYLNNTISDRIIYKCNSNQKLNIFGFSDASYITEGNSKSRLGGCLFMNEYSGAVYTFSKNASTISHSSTEAEIKAIDKLCQFISHFLDIMKFLKIVYDKPIIVFVDNKSAITLCETLKASNNIKIINVRINYIRELINSRVIELLFIPTELNVADMLTKPLSTTVFNIHKQSLLNGFEKNESFIKFLNDGLSKKDIIKQTKTVGFK
jgi:hypothetical protein